jgi:hypothetical protein
MAVIDHDHSYQPSAAPDHTKLEGLISGIGFLAFWLAFLAGVWALHALVDRLL